MFYFQCRTGIWKKGKKKAVSSFLIVLNWGGKYYFGQKLKWILFIKFFVDGKQRGSATYYKLLM